MIAVIGTGYWGKNLVRNFYNLKALHTIYDTNADTVHALQKQYPGVKSADTYADVLNNPEIKGIAIATPAETHANLAKEAILAGKDVFVEKPLCLLEPEGHELNRLAKEHGRVLMIGHLLWYHPAVTMLKSMVVGGELGRIQYIYSNRLNLGKLRREENVLWSFAPHDISVIIGLVGEMPESVMTQGGNYLHQQIADTTASLLNFASGIRAHIFVSWLHPFKEQKLVVVGDHQMAVFDDTVPWDEKLKLYPHTIQWKENIPIASKADARKITIKEEEPLRNECLHFLECIKSRTKPLTDGEEGLKVLQILNACQRSLEQKEKITIRHKSIPLQSYFVHDKAEVEDNVEIGQGTKIWHFSHVLSNSRIGERCNIGQNVVIGPDVTIGNGCKIQNNVSVYKGVTLEDDVFCGPSMVFTNVMNPRAAVSRKDEFRKTRVKKGATLGANCTIVCGITVGEYSLIGAGAVVIRDVPAFALMVGNPARQIGWVSRFGERLNFPIDGAGECACPHTGDRYILENNVCRLLS